MRVSWIVIVSLAAAAAPLAAQRDGTFRRSIAFLRDDLVIEVTADGAGSLSLMRGGRASIEIAASADRALVDVAAPGSPGEPLRLRAVGGGRADWIVTVPERARVQVRTPSMGHIASAGRAAATWHWGGEQRYHRAARADDRPHGQPRTPAFAFSDATAPDTIALTSLAGVRRIVVHYEGEEFGLSASAGMSVTRSGDRRVEVTPREADGADLLLVLPARSTTTVTAAGTVLLDTSRSTRCSPVTINTLEGGVRVFHFTPLHGALHCEG